MSQFIYIYTQFSCRERLIDFSYIVNFEPNFFNFYWSIFIAHSNFLVILVEFHNLLLLNMAQQYTEMENS